MISIVKGNAVRVHWGIFQVINGEEEPLDLSAYEDIMVDIGLQYNKFSVKPTTVDSNILEFVIEGPKQRLGPASISARWNKNNARVSLRGEIVFVEDSRLADIQTHEGGCIVALTTNVGEYELGESYRDLRDKPSINGISLSGKHSGRTLGLVDAVKGKGLSTNDFTDDLKSKVEELVPTDEFPQNPTLGMYHFNSTEKKPYWWNGESWITINN